MYIINILYYTQVPSGLGGTLNDISSEFGEETEQLLGAASAFGVTTKRLSVT
jgi:hypothetical protein